MILGKALKAQEEGDEAKSDRLLVMWDRLVKTVKLATLTQNPTPNPTNLVPQKRAAADHAENKVGDTRFVWGVNNTHDDGGFTPYFHKNTSELKGPIPFTIFNKEWQEKAPMFQLTNHPRINKTAAEKGLVYHGYPVPDKWLQTFMEWTLNHASARETLGIKYKYNTLGQWLVIHKASCDKLLKKHGFMVALRYNIQIRNNAFAFQPKLKGEESFSNISIFKQDTADNTYAKAKDFGEVG
ncbi:hypothetical protein PTTG_05582 [Puccinia triticina 1-1 BBBD Race 1]|uniref:Uncharacterized protein n=1 Tax=Puccinia triticina (isolate 1-1 / race 1 (BBBD)) TaxID=630390 RepID=A0A0C4EXN3_PUCT1|nr:hypothetical protein PTTG_05582 [Puccinia triticina 1-1 BBBD Race 1]